MKMTNQEIFDLLAENECKLRYASWADKDNKALWSAYEAARSALIDFAKATTKPARPTASAAAGASPAAPHGAGAHGL